MNKGEHTALAGIVLLCVLLLSLLAAFNQVKTLGLSWQEEHYLVRLEAVFAGEAPSPWQYRVLTDGAVLLACRAFEACGAPRPVGVAMVVFRVAQNVLLFLAALWYFRRLGIPVYTGLLGLMALAWSMTLSNYASDLAANTYSDILFYLLAAAAIVSRQPGWALPVTALAAFNRETSVLIPVMLAAAAVATPETAARRRMLRYAAMAMGIYLAVFLALRLGFGPRPWGAHPSGAAPGWELLLHNLGHDRTWGHLAGTWGLIPVIAAVSWRGWRHPLGAFFWAIVPAWVALHFLFAPIAESRVLLMPLVVVFLPAALRGLHYWRAKEWGEATASGESTS